MEYLASYPLQNAFQHLSADALPCLTASTTTKTKPRALTLNLSISIWLRRSEWGLDEADFPWGGRLRIEGGLSSSSPGGSVSCDSELSPPVPPPQALGAIWNHLGFSGFQEGPRDHVPKLYCSRKQPLSGQLSNDRLTKCTLVAWSLIYVAGCSPSNTC